jgi:hypothetical protein
MKFRTPPIFTFNVSIIIDKEKPDSNTMTTFVSFLELMLTFMSKEGKNSSGT